MDEISKFLSGLSPEKRALLELRIRDKRNVSYATQPIPHQKAARDYPLSFTQEQLWFLYQLEPESPFYNTPRAFRLKGSLNFIALEQSLNDIVKRHAILRTIFLTTEGQPTQVI